MFGRLDNFMNRDNNKRRSRLGTYGQGISKIILAKKQCVWGKNSSITCKIYLILILFNTINDNFGIINKTVLKNCFNYLNNNS